MATNFKRSNASVSAEADAVCARLNGGSLRIYSGAQPADADAPIVDQVLLAELRFGSPAFASAVDGVAAAHAITAATAATSGDPAWFRTVTSDGNGVGFDGSVGTSDCDLNLSTTAIVANAEVSVSAMTYTARRS